MLFYSAWRSWRQGRPEAAAAAIVAARLVLRMYAGCDLFLHTWDERYHALVAKHLIQHPLVPTLYDQPVLPYDYRDWRSNHVWLHKPPLALWMMAASMRLLGVDEIAMRLPSLMLSALAILLTYVRALHWAVLVLLPLLPLRYTVERMKIRPGYDRNPAWARALRELPARLGPGPPVVLFHLERPLASTARTPRSPAPPRRRSIPDRTAAPRLSISSTSSASEVL